MIADLDTSLSPEPGEDKTAPKAEIRRGRREFRQHLPALRERFPLVFPEDIKAVKPLHHSVTAAVAQAMGWTFPFARRRKGLQAFYPLLSCRFAPPGKDRPGR
jgi:hypothetical protein